MKVTVTQVSLVFMRAASEVILLWCMVD